MTAYVHAMSLAAGLLVGTVFTACRMRWPVAVTALMIAAAFVSARIRLRILFCCIGLALGAGWVGLWRAQHRQSFMFGKPVSFQATVSQPPDVRSDHVLLTVRPDGSRSAVLVRVDRYPPRAYGDRLKLRGELAPPQPFNGFDYPLFLERYGIGATMMQPTYVAKTGYDPPSRMLAALYRLRDSIESRINEGLPEPESSFLAGILLGSKRAIPASVQSGLQTTGTTHIIAISGENITVLLVIVLRLLPVASPGRKFWLTVCIAAVVTLMTGASASVLRGAAVGCLLAFLRWRSRRAWSEPLLLCSLTLCVLGNPLLLAADPGFQLSFAAFAGLLYGGPVCTRLVERTPLRHLPESVRSAAAETVAATIGTLPISLKVFGQVSLIGLLVNPLVLWLIPPITSLSLGFVLVPPLSGPLRLPIWLLLHASLSIIGWFGQFEAGLIHWQIGWWQVAMGYGLLFVLTRSALRRVPLQD